MGPFSTDLSFVISVSPKEERCYIVMGYRYFRVGRFRQISSQSQSDGRRLRLVQRTNTNERFVETKLKNVVKFNLNQTDKLVVDFTYVRSRRRFALSYCSLCFFTLKNLTENVHNRLLSSRSEMRSWRNDN